MSFTAPETVSRTALLGFRMWDSVTAHVITDGLSVTEVSSGAAAVLGPSGVFSFHDLPGLRRSAFGDGSEDFWSAPPVSNSFRFEVADATGSFLTVAVHATAPTRGLLTLPGASPPLVGELPLFSSPSRRFLSDTAVVRADLWDAHAGHPAAAAVLEVTTAQDAVYQGISDPQGRVVVAFPYPEPALGVGSPPVGTGPLSAQTWALRLSVRYGPVSPPVGLSPDLDQVLAQPPATPLEQLSPASPLTNLTLSYGSDLVLRTAGESTLSVLTT